MLDVLGEIVADVGARSVRKCQSPWVLRFKHVLVLIAPGMHPTANSNGTKK